MGYQMDDVIERALEMVEECPVIAYDTETNGVDWKRCEVVGYVITSEDESLYIPVRHGGGANISNATKFEKALAEAFRIRSERGFVTVMHNAKFDIHMSLNHGIMIGAPVEDTAINEALIYELYGSYSLDACCQRYNVPQKMGTDLYNHLADLFGGPADRKQMGNYWKLSGDDKLAVEYAVADGVSTLALWREQQNKLDANNLWSVHRIESDLIPEIVWIERRGIKIDEERVNSIVSELEGQIAERMATLPKDFNVRSPSQIKAYVGAAGRCDWPVTEKGNPSFTKKWLNSFEEGKRIIDIRERSNLINSFAQPLIERHTFNGRVHCQLHQMKQDEYGTISGRFSSSDPNLQQVPKANKELGALIRSCFIPDDGFAFYEADYSQCEPRLFAHYTEAPYLVEGYNAVPPRDMHATVAELLGVERDPTAKRMNMGLLTGMGINALAGHMGWDRAYTKGMYEKYFAQMPELRKFSKHAAAVFESRGYVRTLLGRRCHLEHRSYSYRAVSRIIQGGNADITKYKLLTACRYAREHNHRIQMLMTVHDSFEFQAEDTPEGHKIAMDMIEILSDVRSEPFNLSVPFKMDVHKGKNWKEATYG